MHRWYSVVPFYWNIPIFIDTKFSTTFRCLRGQAPPYVMEITARDQSLVSHRGIVYVLSAAIFWT